MGLQAQESGVLTAPGQSVTVNALYSDYKISAQVTVSSINTNVVVRLEVSNDGTNWVNANSSGTDQTLTANGSYMLAVSDIPVSLARLLFVSETGGTAAVLNVNVLAG